MIGSIAFAVFSFIFCLIFCWFRTNKASVYSLVLKIVASGCFCFCALFAVKSIGESSFNMLIIIGLVLGLIGDILLDLKIMYPAQGDQYFVAGTAAFGFGHLFYFLGVLVFACSFSPITLVWQIIASIVIGVAITVGIILSSKKLGINFGKHLYVVALYSFVLSFMTVLSIAVAIFIPIFWIFAVGMILFFLSDLVLSLQYFGGRTQKALVYVNHILYYLAQIAIAISLLYLTV